MNVTNIFEEMKALSSNQRTSAKKTDLTGLKAKQRGESLESTNSGIISTDERFTGQSPSVDQETSEALPSFQEDPLVFQQIEIIPNPVEIEGNIITTLPPSISNSPPSTPRNRTLAKNRRRREKERMVKNKVEFQQLILPQFFSARAAEPTKC